MTGSIYLLAPYGRGEKNILDIARVSEQPQAEALLITPWPLWH